jgi:23S rRNA (uracil1939-C5)-methyltransferase
VKTRGLRAEVTISEIATGGDGVAHLDIAGERRVVFVPGTAPGDVVQVEIDTSSRPARGHVRRLVTHSIQRREPACPLADECGGCSLMHLVPAARERALAGIVKGSVLRALGDVPTTHHPAPRSEGWRTRARLGVIGGARATVGFRGRHAGRVVDVPTCLVLDPRVDAAISVLRDALSGSRGRGEASVALGRAAAVVDLTWEGELAPAAYGALERAVIAGSLSGVSVRLPGASAPAKIGDPTVVTIAADGAPLLVPSGGFAQANPEVSLALGAVVAGMARTADRDVVELYSGAGNLTTLLAPGARSYLAIESDADAVACCRQNLRARSLGGVKVLQGDAGRAALPKRCDVVVLDPPRAGARETLAGIAAMRTSDVVYVSCDPMTLARDAALLVGLGFTARWLHTFDMFPHTHHVESVLHLAR